jgi:hypothetical protein
LLAGAAACTWQVSQLTALWQSDDPDAEAFLDFVSHWIQLTGVLNALSRSLGQPDFNPFILPRAVVGKLQFIHLRVAQARREGGRLHGTP